MPNTTAESNRPFECLVCHNRFTRHENLKRHAALHCRSPDRAAAAGTSSLSCALCSATFSRPDLRSRHMKRKHLERNWDPSSKSRRISSRTAFDVLALQIPQQGVETLCEAHVVSPASNDDVDTVSVGKLLYSCCGQPDQIDDSIRSNDESVLGFPTPPRRASALHELDNVQREFADPEDAAVSAGVVSDSSVLEASFQSCAFTAHSPDADLSIDISDAQDCWFPSDSQIARGCQLFFSHISPFMPFFHRPTFDTAKAPCYLLQSMFCLAYQYGEDPDSGDQEGSGASLSDRFFDHACRNTFQLEDGRHDDDLSGRLCTVQAYLLLQIYTTMFQCTSTGDTSYGLQKHAKMIALARATGLTQQARPDPHDTRDLDSLWSQFIEAESRKRTLFAIHQIDALWYQLISVPRQLSHLEIKYELPCPEEYWTASTSAEWAHRRLASTHSNSFILYPDAIRSILSPASTLQNLPPFSLYGAINITQFLASSARELSGWCSMTGMFSTDRIQPLESSLRALGSFIHLQTVAPYTSYGTLCEATWQFAMIESQMWSASHMDGVVGGRLDALPQRMTDVTLSLESLYETGAADAIQPHVDWFIRYLDTTTTPDTEAPWIILYAYHAFVIAWYCATRGQVHFLQSAGIEQMDPKAALVWAKDVFGRRRRWHLGRVILSTLDRLDPCSKAFFEADTLHEA